LTELGLAIINLRSKRLSVVTWNGFPSQAQIIQASVKEKHVGYKKCSDYPRKRKLRLTAGARLMLTVVTKK